MANSNVVPCRGPMLPEDSIDSYAQLPVVGALIIPDDNLMTPTVRCPCFSYYKIESRSISKCGLRVSREIVHCVYVP